MSKTKTEAERKEFLASLDLNPDAPALETFERPLLKPLPIGIVWAPEGIDPHTMPVSDIAFDPAMVEHFPDLSPRGRSAASRELFERYKSYGRNKDRNSLLHRRIGEFLGRVHRDRETGGGGFVKDKIRLANTMAEHGVTEDDLAEFLAWKAQQ
jgi:hypothetical protein